MRLFFAIVAAFLLVAGFYLFDLFQFVSAIPNPHSLKYNDSSFSKIANDIINQHEIFQMNDCSRYTKTLNSVSIKMTGNGNEEDSFYHPIFYKKLLDSLHISPINFENLKAQLSSTGLFSFYRSGDSVLFEVDGFLNSGWGYLYVSGGIKDTSESSVRNIEYNVVDSVNNKWSKVGIY